MWLLPEVKRVSRITLCEAVTVELTKFLKLVVEKGASDGFASVGSAPIFKVNGELVAHGDHILSANDITSLIRASMAAH
jgi:Tfp pilus assembly ATPase PilU